VVQQRPGITGKPVRLAEPPPLLAGREDLLAELDARLAGGDGSRPRTVVLTGFGGTGKTSVALRYAHRHLAEVGVAWQFAAEDKTVLAAGFGELAAQLGARGLADIRDPVASVHAVLARFPAPWLLIFDNAVDLASVAAFLPPAGPGRVLITSQDQSWPPGRALTVPVLGTRVAAGFLVNRSGDPDEQAAAELAAEVGGLPLALEQAAAYVQAAGSTFAEYLAWFRQRRPDVLSRGQPTGYGKTVATTWSLAFAKLEESAPTAVSLLRLLACCAPEAVPLFMLVQSGPALADTLGAEVAAALVPLLDDSLAVSDAIAALRRYSLVIPAGGGSVLVHRLVQAVTIDQMPPELTSQWRQAAAALIEAAIPDDTAQPEAWPMCAALLPHALAALAEDSDGMGRLGNYLGRRGGYGAAVDLQRRVLTAYERSSGPEHPALLTARNDLAFWTGMAGDPAAARDQFAALLPVRERVHGAEHPATLTARHNLARWTGQAGDPAAARDQFAALVPVFERVQGPEHPRTLLARGNLAIFTGLAGDAAASRDQLAALLPVEERVHGSEHPLTLNTRGNLAFSTGEAGDPAAARDQLAALVPICEQILAADHPDTLIVRGALAHWTGEAGDPTAARDQLAALLPVIEQILGQEHPRVLGGRRAFARWTGEAGDSTAARDQLAALLPVIERVLGPEHPDTPAARHELSLWTARADKRP
jgi:hypothetical protein